ncbi:MAG: hypothetical protein HY051_05330 [Candidatus Aenigmarchaeota archaeon]|nr:hypothetical protein [Candidatus Aenigmarchaeota archaeon]
MTSTSRVNKFIIVAITIVFLFVYILPYTFTYSNPYTKKVKDSIIRGIDFLESEQTSSGGFYMHALGINGTATGIDHVSPLAVAYVLYSIKDIPARYLSPQMINKSLQFLIARQENGKWRYFDLKTIQNKNVVYLPPDLDVSSASLIAYYTYGLPFNASSARNLLEHKDASGLIYTYLGHEDAKVYENTDCVINLNAIYLFSLLGQEDAVKDSCNTIVRYGLNTTCSMYYKQDEYVYYYLMSRVLGSGKAACMEPMRKPIENELIKTQKSDGSWGKNVFDTCLSVNSLYNLRKIDSKEIERSLLFVLNMQNEDGSWPVGQLGESGSYNPADRHDIPTFYWGSKAVTTAICLEVLGKYLNYYESG